MNQRYSETEKDLKTVSTKIVKNELQKQTFLFGNPDGSEGKVATMVS